MTRRKRASVLDAAHPERIVGKPPRPLKLPTRAWINRPGNTAEATQ